METLKAIAKRKSTRAFSPEKQISKKELDTILAAGCAAPVGAGDYSSVHLTVVQDPEVLAKINKSAQDTLNMDRSFLYNAPVFVIASASEKQKAPNVQFSNVACIIENMIIAATDSDIDSLYLWGVIGIIAGDAELCKQLHIPDGFTPVSGLALGHSAIDNSTEKELSITLSINYI